MLSISDLYALRQFVQERTKIDPMAAFSLRDLDGYLAKWSDLARWQAPADDQQEVLKWGFFDVVIGLTCFMRDEDCLPYHNALIRLVVNGESIAQDILTALRSEEDADLRWKLIRQKHWTVTGKAANS